MHLYSTSQKNQARYTTVLIDMQPRFLRKASRDLKMGLFLAQRRVLRFCAEERIPTVVLEYVGYGDGETVPCLQQKVDLIHPHLTLEKTRDDGFVRTSLDQQLKEWETTDLVVMGVNASYCVKDTCESAIRKGYRIHTARDFISNTCRCCPTKYDWYEKHSTLYQDSSELIEGTSCSLVSAGLVGRL